MYHRSSVIHIKKKQKQKNNHTGALAGTKPNLSLSLTGCAPKSNWPNGCAIYMSCAACVDLNQRLMQQVNNIAGGVQENDIQ